LHVTAQKNHMEEVFSKYVQRRLKAEKKVVSVKRVLSR
jgi:hypothetical protein